MGLRANTALPRLSVMGHCQRRGSQLLLGQECHLHVYEQGGVAQVRTGTPHLGSAQPAQHFWWEPASQAPCWDLRRKEMAGVVASLRRREGEPLPH